MLLSGLSPGSRLCQGIQGPILEAFESVVSLFEFGFRFTYQSFSLSLNSYFLRNVLPRRSYVI